MLTSEQLKLLLAMIDQSSFPGKVLRLALETQEELQRQLAEMPPDGRVTVERDFVTVQKQ